MSRIKNKWVYYIDYYLDDKSFCEKSLTTEQQKILLSINSKGTELEKYVASWCLENHTALKKEYNNEETHLVTYEELLLKPIKLVNYFSEKFELECKDRMLEQVGIPSKTVRFSDDTTKELFSQKDEERRFKLLYKWKQELTKREEEAIQEILDIMDVKLYRVNEHVPVHPIITNFESLKKIEISYMKRN
jgi:hypothetical protein